MAKFIQIEAVAIRVTDEKGRQHDELELFALDDAGKVHRFAFATGGGWIEMK